MPFLQPAKIPSHHGQWGYHPVHSMPFHAILPASYTIIPEHTKHAEIHKAANWYISVCAEGGIIQESAATPVQEQKHAQSKKHKIANAVVFRYSPI
jgi:hypothetical protein